MSKPDRMNRTELVAFRRVVTGHDAAGLSCVELDDSGHSHGGNVELWSTGDAEPGADPAARPSRLLPPAGGTNIRYVVIQPEAAEAGLSTEERRDGARAFFDSMGAGDALVMSIPHPHAHRTPTTDYIVMLSGEVTLMLEAGERPVRPGDVVVQRGTSHAWVNRGSEPAVFVAVMLDAGRPD